MAGNLLTSHGPMRSWRNVRALRTSGQPWAIRWAGWIIATGTTATASVIAAGALGEPIIDTGQPDRATAIATALKIATGLGALTAGVLAWGKLQLSQQQHALAGKELDQRTSDAADDRKQRDKTHADSHQLAVKTRLDERFASAVQLLGNDDESVRLGALYALEALAQDHPDNSQRQAIYDVICAYVRFRTGLLLGPIDPDTGESVQEPTTVPLPTDYEAAAAIALRAPAEWSIHLNLRGTVLRDHMITTTVLEGCDFSKAFLVGCHVRTRQINSSKFDGATLVLCTFRRLTLSKVTFRASTIERCFFAKSRLDTCTFYEASLKQCEFGGAHLEACNFNETKIEDGWFTSAVLTDSGFEGSVFKGAKFEDSEWSRTSLYRAEFEGAKFDSASFDSCNYTDATFMKSSLADVTFEGAQNFHQSTFDRCALPIDVPDELKAEARLIDIDWLPKATPKRRAAKGGEPVGDDAS